MSSAVDHSMSNPVVPKWGCMDPQGSTERFLGVCELFMQKMKAICYSKTKEIASLV